MTVFQMVCYLIVITFLLTYTSMPDNQLNLRINPDTSNSKESMEIYDVVIVGAGPIGLATAIGLRKRGIENILVIDQTRAFRQVGQVLDLLPNGLKALRYLDDQAYEAVKKTGMGFMSSRQSAKTSPAWVFKNYQGQLIRSVPLSFDHWFQKYGEGRVSIAWYDLQTALRNLLPSEQVKVNHRCINVVDDPENGCVRIDCVSDQGIETNPYAYWIEGKTQDETQPQNLETPKLVTKSLRGKLIVAADGINSTIRRVLYENSPYSDFARPEYSGFAAISCREITEVTPELQTQLAEKFFEDSPIVTISNDHLSPDTTCLDEPRMMLFRRPGGVIGYILHLAISLESLQDKSGSSLLELAMQQLKKAGFPDVLQQLVSLSPPSNMQQRPYYIHHATPSQPSWSAGRIVLVGDAAHGMPPFMAQGANQGLEDASKITNLISNIAENNNWDNQQAIATVFQQYEDLRRPMMTYIQNATLTRFPQSSDEEWNKYGEQVYMREVMG